MTLSLTASDGWVMLTAAACAVACAVPGCFLVLRRLSMLGDAISHAILPGIAIAFILTQSREPIPMLIGASIAGLLTAAFSAMLSRFGRLPEDASLGVVFSVMFALGVLLITKVASNVDLDPGCVLYGLIETVGLAGPHVHIQGFAIPRTTAVLLVTMAVNLTLVAIFYKELKLVCFDAALATALGFSAGLIHYGLLAMVAATTVVSFEAVGSILVISMLVTPVVTAHLLTDKLPRMLVLAGVLAVSSAILGHLGAVWWNTSTAGMISVVAGLQFVLALAFAPRHGLVSRVIDRLSLAIRIASEDMLASLYRTGEGRTDANAKMPFSDTTWRAWLARRRLLNKGLVTVGASQAWMLTPTGQEEALRVIRSHRLWEGYLARHTPLPVDHLHEPSHRVEHFITPEMQAKLESEVGSADPHGRPIPPPNEPGSSLHKRP